MEEDSCFGFEEETETSLPEKTVKPPTFRFLCNVNGPSRANRKVLEKARLPDESRTEEDTLDPPAEKSFSITQVQELLLQDLNPSEFETLNSTMTNDSLIYEDDTDDIREVISPIKVRRKGKGPKVDGDNAEKQNKKRKRGGPRNKKAKEDDGENENTATNENDSEILTPVKTPTRVFSRPVRRKKPLEEIQNFDDENNASSVVSVPSKKVTKKKDTKKKIEEDEKIEKRIEEINAYFKEIEKHKLIVE